MIQSKISVYIVFYLVNRLYMVLMVITFKISLLVYCIFIKLLFSQNAADTNLIWNIQDSYLAITVDHNEAPS